MNDESLSGVQNNEAPEKKKFDIKKYLKRYFIDAFTGMAQGLFVTLIAGTIIKTLGTLIGDNFVGNSLVLLGKIASVLMGAGIGVGIASYLKAPKMVVFAGIVAGFLGAYSTQILAGDMEAISTLISKGLPGNPIGAYVTSVLACEIAALVSGKTRLDILLVPLTSLIVGFIACYVAWPFIWLVNMLGAGISYATEITPFFMGIIIATVMGILLTMPTSSAAIWVAVASGITTDSMLIAGGAAVVGCSCQMIGFAVMSYRENKLSGLISQGLGTSMLQIPNIMKHPKIFIPPIIASAILGPISTCVFQMKCNAVGGGMGTSGLVGPINTFSVMAEAGVPTLAILGEIVLLQFILPAILCFVISEFMRKKGWIKFGEMKLDD